MPEGDTVFRTARRLHQVFAGRPLASCDLRWPGLSTLDFAGDSTVEVVARGKHILHRLASGATIHSHLRMEGSWRVSPAGRRVPASARLRAVLATDAYVACGWSLGMLDVVPTADEGLLVGHLGPDLLGPDWDPALAVARLASAEGTLAAALLDQRNLAGLGTMWTSEVLFLRGLDPFAAASAHDADTLGRLVAHAARLLRRGATAAVPSSTGSLVPAESTYVHGRRHRPCRRCGTLIELAWTGPPTRERTIYYCPSCQGVSPAPRTAAR